MFTTYVCITNNILLCLRYLGPDPNAVILIFFFHSTLCFWDSFMLMYEAIVHYFSLLYSIPLSECVVIHRSTPLCKQCHHKHFHRFPGARVHKLQYPPNLRSLHWWLSGNGLPSGLVFLVTRILSPTLSAALKSFSVFKGGFRIMSDKKTQVISGQKKKKKKRWGREENCIGMNDGAV